eukprot:SAG31_NODE_4194_length_3486_cov_1.765870_4_plen_204_part_00
MQAYPPVQPGRLLLQQPVATLDGAAVLACDVWLPPASRHGDGPWPVLLCRSQHGTERYLPWMQRFTNETGLAVVLQDVRGKVSQYISMYLKISQDISKHLRSRGQRRAEPVGVLPARGGRRRCHGGLGGRAALVRRQDRDVRIQLRWVHADVGGALRPHSAAGIGASGLAAGQFWPLARGWRLALGRLLAGADDGRTHGAPRQ